MSATLDPPAIAVLDAITAAGLGLVRGQNAFAGPLRPSKTLACFVQSTGGLVPFLLSGDAQQEMQTVQVQVWSPPDAYQAGYQLAQGILRALHRRELGGYYHTEVREADPSPIGKDDNDRHGFAINVELHGIRRQ